jgi:hypothetical protein
MRKQVEAWQRSQLTDVTAKEVIYEAFIRQLGQSPGVVGVTCIRAIGSLARAGICQARFMKSGSGLPSWPDRWPRRYSRGGRWRWRN